MTIEVLPGVYKDSRGRSYTRSINHGTPAGYRLHTKYKVPMCDECRAADRVARGRRATPPPLTKYLTVHSALRKRRGRARDYECPCGARAAEWAYIKSPNEIVNEDGRKFSPNLDDYAPRCIPCHRRMDKAEITHCPQAHAYEGDNLIVDARGRRACRTCKRLRLHVSNLTPEQLAKRRKQKREHERRRRERAQLAREQGAA